MASQGPNSPGTIADDAAVGVLTWSTPSNAATSDNAYAFAGNGYGSNQATHYLKVTNLGFSIPSGSSIDGVEVAIERKGSHASAARCVKDSVVKLVKAGSVSGDNKAATGTLWPTSDASANYGGVSDLWGLSLSVDDVNSSTFGAVLSANVLSDYGKTTIFAYVDHITVTITYTEGGGGASGIPKQQMHYARQRR